MTQAHADVGMPPGLIDAVLHLVSTGPVPLGGYSLAEMVAVDAVVDFSELSAGAIAVDPDDPTAVTVTLPGAYLGDPQLDHERTEVLSRERGVFDRIGDAISGDPADDEALYRMGEDELRRLAIQTELQERGEANTRKMLEGMLGSLGFERVTIRFEAPLP